MAPRPPPEIIELSEDEDGASQLDIQRRAIASSRAPAPAAPNAEAPIAIGSDDEEAPTSDTLPVMRDTQRAQRDTQRAVAQPTVQSTSGRPRGASAVPATGAVSEGRKRVLQHDHSEAAAVAAARRAALAALAPIRPAPFSDLAQSLKTHDLHTAAAQRAPLANGIGVRGPSPASVGLRAAIPMQSSKRTSLSSLSISHAARASASSSASPIQPAPTAATLGFNTTTPVSRLCGVLQTLFPRLKVPSTMSDSTRISFINLIQAAYDVQQARSRILELYESGKATPAMLPTLLSERQNRTCDPRVKPTSAVPEHVQRHSVDSLPLKLLQDAFVLAGFESAQVIALSTSLDQNLLGNDSALVATTRADRRLPIDPAVEDIAIVGDFSPLISDGPHIYSRMRTYIAHARRFVRLYLARWGIRSPDILLGSAIWHYLFSSGTYTCEGIDRSGRAATYANVFDSGSVGFFSLPDLYGSSMMVSSAAKASFFTGLEDSLQYHRKLTFLATLIQERAFRIAA